jgi:hypothetical protein
MVASADDILCRPSPESADVCHEQLFSSLTGNLSHRFIEAMIAAHEVESGDVVEGFASPAAVLADVHGNGRSNVIAQDAGHVTGVVSGEISGGFEQEAHKNDAIMRA